MAFLSCAANGQALRLPTSNTAIYEAGGEERYFVGTVGKNWVSGTFGCVRSNGQQLHEGIDIRCMERDRRGEPVDPVLAAAGGEVAYMNLKQGLSNYGRYLVLRHRIDGLEVYSLYAHLKEFRPGLAVGRSVQAGEVVATMGRTANTHQGIARDRAHLHFELNLFMNDRFAAWFKGANPGQRNDHGLWNGQNLTGLDPRLVLLAERQQGSSFNLLQFTRNQTELCRVYVKSTQFPWLRRYPALIRRNPVAEKEGIVGYEIALNYVGLPYELIPRASSEIKSSGSKYQLLSVNASEVSKNPARHLVARQGSHWILTNHGHKLLDLLTY
jgi:hypothetical protein